MMSLLTTLSDYAHRVNLLMLTLLAISSFFVIVIGSLLLFFVIKYRRTTQNEVAHDVKNQTWLEITWTSIPLVLTIGIFAWGADQFMVFEQTPLNAREISVLARQWMWKFRSLDGIEEINELHLPVGGTFKLTMISQDVIHSFYLPDLRVKYDVLPGRYTQLWFQPQKTGNFPILCSQYCGTDHSQMIGRLIVMGKNDYDTWKRTQHARSELGPEDSGQALFTQKACASCHSVERLGADRDQNPASTRAAKIGPPLVGLAGSEVNVVQLGKKMRVLADDDYLRESILDPAHTITEGFQNVMPSYKGQLSEEEILNLIAYIKDPQTDRIEIQGRNLRSGSANSEKKPQTDSNNPPPNGVK